MTAQRMLISGRVQGVFFRREACKRAVQLGITGWVRNCRGGTVEVHAEGGSAQLDAFTRWCRRGPPEAEVENLFLSSALSEHCATFCIAPDAA